MEAVESNTTIHTTPEDWADAPQDLRAGSATGKKKHHKTLIGRVFRIIGGIILMLAGLVMLVLPGPGLLALAGGAVLVASAFDIDLTDRFKAWRAKQKEKEAR